MRSIILIKFEIMICSYHFIPITKLSFSMGNIIHLCLLIVGPVHFCFHLISFKFLFTICISFLFFNSFLSHHRIRFSKRELANEALANNGEEIPNYLWYETFLGWPINFCLLFNRRKLQLISFDRFGTLSSFLVNADINGVGSHDSHNCHIHKIKEHGHCVHGEDKHNYQWCKGINLEVFYSY